MAKLIEAYIGGYALVNLFKHQWFNQPGKAHDDQSNTQHSKKCGRLLFDQVVVHSVAKEMTDEGAGK